MKKIVLLKLNLFLAVFLAFYYSGYAEASGNEGGGGGSSRDEIAPLDSESFSFVDDPWVKRLAEVYPQTMTGLDQIPSFEIIEAMRRVKSDKREPDDSARIRDMRLLFDHRYKKAKDYATLLKEQPHLSDSESQKILEGAEKELDKIYKEGPLIINYFRLDLGLMRLSMIASRNGHESEEGVYEFLKGFYNGMKGENLPVDKSEKPALEISTEALLEYRILKRSGTPSHIKDGFYNLSKLARKNLKSCLRGIKPIRIEIIGGKTGLTTITLMLLNDLHNISFSPTAVTAHGLFISPKEFGGVHDYAHETESKYKTHVKAWAGRLSRQLMDEGLNYKQATNIAGRIAIHKVKQAAGGLLKLLKNSAWNYIRTLEEEPSVAEKRIARCLYNKRLICIFTACHETGRYIDTQVLDATSESKAAEIFLHRVIERNESQQIDELDPFVTHPVTGKIGVSGVDLVNAINNLSVKNTLGIPSEHKTLGAECGGVLDRSIKESSTLIDIKTELEDGREIKSRTPTLRLRYGDELDQRSLLRLAGINVPLPDLENSEHHVARQKAYDFIDEVRTKFRSLTESVQADAIKELDEMNKIPEGCDKAGTDVSTMALRQKEDQAIAEERLTPRLQYSALRKVRSYQYENLVTSR